jgi:DNA-directed RNA polymerase specialized sigma24 family protein
MTTLDHRLYAWLLEPDEQRFERAFKAYFDVAYPSVIRRLARLSRWDPLHLEELAQDALLRFFDKVGRDRREASEAVRLWLPQLRPLNFGVFHERLITGWTKEVGSFREAAMGFRPPQPDDTEWKTCIHALAERIPALQGQGRHLLHSVHLELRWVSDDAEIASAVPTEPDTDQIRGQSDDDSQNKGPGVLASNTCEQQLVEEMLAKSARAIGAEEAHPGTSVFVQGTSTIVRVLPRLRVPTNGYLFEIAATIYLDECKKRGRQKRGGTSAFTRDQPETADHGDIAFNNPMEPLTLDSFSGDDGEERFDDAAPPMAAHCATGFTVPAVDPTSRYENEDLFEKFYDYLRKPLDDAIETFHKAQKSGRGAAERRRVDALTDKFSRSMSVLSILGEGYTQEQTAERLGLSRNQVKYIIESVQEAYARFAADFACPATLSPTAVGQSHVA